MSEFIESIAAEAEQMGSLGEEHKVPRFHMSSQTVRDRAPLGLTDLEHRERRESQKPHFWQQRPEVGHPQISEQIAEYASIPDGSREEARERRIYRGRTINMLRRYMQYSIDTGRLPSVLGREFFRAKVSARSAVTFEDRVIFVVDMETSLNKLDEFSREIIARHILQEHDQEATARLLHCGTRTIQRYIPIALDLLSEILLDVGLLERTFPIREHSCQGGKTGENVVSSS